jgi:quinol monooxygenase YgiN
MIHVIASIRAQPAHADGLQAALLKLALASRSDAGCQSYRVLRCADDPALFATFEQWADADAEARHMQSAHIAEAFGVAGPLLATPPDIRRFTEI